MLTPLPVLDLENFKYYIFIVQSVSLKQILSYGAGTGPGKSFRLPRPQYTYPGGSSVGTDHPSSCSRLCRFTGCEVNFPEHRPNNSASRPV
jgi:hypothetical protein